MTNETFAAGQRVQVHSLNPVLNGKLGVLVARAEGGEWCVELLEVGELRIRTENLLVCFVDMSLLAKFRSPTQRSACRDAAKLCIAEWESHASHGHDSDEEPRVCLSSPSLDGRVFQIDGVFTAAECATILRAVHKAALYRGWNRMRHGQVPTTDLPLAALGDECEAWVRAAVFQKVLRPLMPFYVPASSTLMPEHLEFHDLFVVRYSAAHGEQRELQPHEDGSLFSFNLLLCDPNDFDGGGTYFEATKRTVHAPQGGAIGHGGAVRHSGLAITRGERYLLVGFVHVGCAESAAAFSLERLDWATHHAFLKFGEGAWRRSCPGKEPSIV